MQAYTAIGSQKTPDDIQALQVRLGKALSLRGWLGRSGHADGSDKSWEEGAEQGSKEGGRGMEVYLPWDGFNDGFDTGEWDLNRICHIDAKRLPNYAKAQHIASTVHPVWDKLTFGPKTMHSRNPYQVLGIDLETPSKALMCWAPPIKDGVRGGTGTAVRLAMQYGIPIHNLYFDEVCREAEKKILGLD